MLCHKILDSLRKNYVEEFSRKSKLNEGKDVFIMDNEDELPTPEQVRRLETKIFLGCFKCNCCSIIIIL